MARNYGTSYLHLHLAIACIFSASIHIFVVFFSNVFKRFAHVKFSIICNSYVLWIIFRFSAAVKTTGTGRATQTDADEAVIF